MEPHTIPHAVRKGLTYGLDFCPVPPSHEKGVELYVTVYKEDLKKELTTLTHKHTRWLLQPQRFPLQWTVPQREVSAMLRHPYLKRDKPCVTFVPTDKNMGVAIVANAWMEYHCRMFLTDELNYVPVLEDNLAIGEELYLQQVIVPTYNEEIMEINSEWKSLLLDPKEASFARFYCIPKVHKKKQPPPALFPARPITGAHNAITKKLSLLLHAVFTHIKDGAHVRWNEEDVPMVFSAEEAIKTVHRAIKHRGTVELKTYDFTNMYSNIGIEISIELIMDLLAMMGHRDLSFEMEVEIPLKSPSIYHHVLKRMLHHQTVVKKFKVRLNLLPRLMRMCLTRYAYVTCKHHPGLFRQIRGYAMGTNCAPLGASLTALSCEMKAFMASRHVPFLIRYIDDLLVPAHPGEDLTEELERIYAPSGLKFTESSPGGNKVPYLDVMFDRVQSSQLTFGIFGKEGNAYEYHHFCSYSPLYVKRGVVIGGTIRILSRNTSPYNAQRDFDRFVHLLQRRGYPLPFIQRTLDRYATSKSKHPDDKPSAWIITDYCQHLPGPAFKAKAEEVYGLSEVGISLRCHPKVSYYLTR